MFLLTNNKIVSVSYLFEIIFLYKKSIKLFFSIKNVNKDAIHVKYILLHVHNAAKIEYIPQFVLVNKVYKEKIVI